MKSISRILFILLATVAIAAMGCSASRKSNCGCPNKQGMVGY